MASFPYFLFMGLKTVQDNAIDDATSDDQVKNSRGVLLTQAITDIRILT